jgi:nucleotide-binding universal stress UspA family protein
MRTLLVPTDFSSLSKAGLSYAIALAKKIDARITVLTVITEVTADRQEVVNLKKYQDNMIATARSDGKLLLDEFKAEAGKVDISFEAIAGYPVVDVVEKFAVEKKVSLIVMSSKGATGLKKIVMGSNAAAVIDNSSIPVMVVPGEASTKALRKVVYASDAQDFEKEVKIAASFAELFGASMEVAHVVPEEGARKDPSEITAQKLKTIASYPKIHLHVLYDKDVSRGLLTFIKNQREDFTLITFTHRLSFNEKLFGKSVTQQLAYHNSVPLVVVNKSNYKGIR